MGRGWGGRGALQHWGAAGRSGSGRGQAHHHTVAKYLNYQGQQSDAPGKRAESQSQQSSDPMNWTVFSLVTVLDFSFQYSSQLNHSIWKMTGWFIFSDWLMSPGCCQIWTCHPQNSLPALPLVQKCAPWEKANPGSGWAAGKLCYGLNAESGVECSFRKQDFFFLKKSQDR